MDIYLYIFIMTFVGVFVILIAINVCLKSHDTLFAAIERIKQTKASNTNELSWKPSEEQMEALNKAIEFFQENRYMCRPLLSLYNDLKKL